MIWFKHFTGYRNDPKVRALREEFGIEGAAVPMLMVEIVAESLGITNQIPFLTHSRAVWAEMLGIKASKLSKILAKMQDVNLFEVRVESDGKITFGSDKILIYCDEYTQTLKRQGKISAEKYGNKYRDSSPDSPPERSRVRKKEVERKKDLKTATPAFEGGVAQSTAGSTEAGVEDPKARAEAMKTIRDAMAKISVGSQERKVVEPEDSGNRKIPTATGPEVEAMGIVLEGQGIADPMLQDILDAWWAIKCGTHNVFVLASTLDKYGLKGHDRSSLYQTLGVV